eukprot:5486605-Pyramimonas_sp.AAC.1
MYRACDRSKIDGGLFMVGPEQRCLRRSCKVLSIHGILITWRRRRNWWVHGQSPRADPPAHVQLKRLGAHLTDGQLAVRGGKLRDSSTARANLSLMYVPFQFQCAPAKL